MDRSDKFLALLFLGIYTTVSFLVFNQVFDTSSEVIDELFHLWQGYQYCVGNFSAWEPKITTFPGLYLLSSVIPADYCDIYTLRLVPLVCSIVNFFLIYEIKSLILYSSVKKNNNDVLLETITLVTLPPMYFFSHIYYTDVPSITMVLFMLLFSLQKYHKLSSVFAAASVLMRQTNVVWVASTLGVHMVDKMMLKIYPKMKRESMTFGNFLFAFKSHFKHPKILMEFVLGSIRDFFGYIVVILGFIAFLFVNGSVVVGDKSAHEAAIHVPQLFYFSLFVLFFGSSLWIPQLLKIHKIFGSWRCLLAITFLAGVMALIIRYNTIVHPYLLADNRHYTFYIWKRFYERHELARYAIIPAYIFGLITIVNSLDGSIGFKMFFIISTVLTLCLQQMIEVRYFFIPFLLLRLNRKTMSIQWTFLELLGNIFINQVTFMMFFRVQIKWDNFEDIQRLIW